ncbi:MAG: substrate-binding domain-containing protein, partial [Pontimonas sp.]
MITRSKTLAGVALLASAAFVLAGCSTSEGSSAGDGSGLSGTLVGAGASSQGAAQEAWVAGFQTANEEVTVTYDPIGSGGGRETFQSGASSFAGSDRAFKV